MSFLDVLITEVSETRHQIIPIPISATLEIEAKLYFSSYLYLYLYFHLYVYLCLYLSETWHGPEYPDFLYQCHVGNWCKIVFFFSFVNCVCIFISMCIYFCLYFLHETQHGPRLSRSVSVAHWKLCFSSHLYL